jgi:SAM-dependent methyltransferase
MTGQHYYDRVSRTYAERRRPDPRIEVAVWAALADAASVINVGAGAGSYEPPDRLVVAVEPSEAMLALRRAPAPAIRAAAEALPFRDASFDAALAVLTLHHWSDWRLGISELRRVARRRAVLLTFDPEADPPFWVFHYFPEVRARDRIRMPPVAELCALLDAHAAPLPIPYDCVDGFLGAYWRTPWMYLNPAARSGMSAFAMLSEPELARGLQHLERDLASGVWTSRYGRLLKQESADIGYRLIVGEWG